MLGFGEAKGLLRDASLGCGGVADCQGPPHTLLQRDLPQLGYLPPAHTHLQQQPLPTPISPTSGRLLSPQLSGCGGQERRIWGRGRVTTEYNPLDQSPRSTWGVQEGLQPPPPQQGRIKHISMET